MSIKELFDGELEAMSDQMAHGITIGDRLAMEGFDNEDAVELGMVTIILAEIFPSMVRHAWHQRGTPHSGLEQALGEVAVLFFLAGMRHERERLRED